MKTKSTPHFLAIIVHPTRTFIEIFKEQSGLKHIVPLLLLGSIGQVCYRFWDIKNETYLFSSFLTSSFLALLVGWIGFVIFSWILHYSCKFLGGSASLDKSITIVAWSLVPSIAGLLFFLLYITVVDVSFLNSIGDLGLTTVKTIIVTIRSVLGLTSLFILIGGISSAYKLTFFKSFLALIFPILLFLTLTFFLTLI